MSTARRRRRYLCWVRYDLRCAAINPTEPVHIGRWHAAQALNTATRTYFDEHGHDIRLRRLWPPRS